MKIASSFKTGDYHGYNVKYSPFLKNVLACASCENYGIAGRGRLYLLSLENPCLPIIISSFEWHEGLFDVTWSEANTQLLLTSCGDGSIQVWDYMLSSKPVALYKIHDKEVYSVEWNPRNTYSCVLSASWDHSVKVWNPYNGKEVCSFLEHTDQVYEAKWSPCYPERFSSVSGDGTLKLWDTRHQKTTGSVPHGTEVLCCDWSKSDSNSLAVGTTDGKIIGWDLRNMVDPVYVLVGHQYAIRRLKFSPFERGSIASVSYDFTTKFWNWDVPQAIYSHDKHTEFVYGLDFNPQNPYEISDCAWDSMIHVYNGSIVRA